MNGQTKFRDLWRWRLARAIETTGRTGWLGLAAVVLALIMASALLRGMAQKTQALEQEIQDLRQGKTEDSKNGASANLPLLLPGANASTEFAALLHQLSTRESVRIDRMEYQLQRETGKALLLYRVDLVAIAPYLNLRNWIDAVLKERPTVAIDELVLERPNSELNDITARVRLTLYMKGET